MSYHAGGGGASGSGTGTGTGNNTEVFAGLGLFCSSVIPTATVEKLKLLIEHLNSEYGFGLRKLGRKAELVAKITEAFYSFRDKNQPEYYRRSKLAFETIMNPHSSSSANNSLSPAPGPNSNSWVARANATVDQYGYPRPNGHGGLGGGPAGMGRYGLPNGYAPAGSGSGPSGDGVNNRWPGGSGTAYGANPRFGTYNPHAASSSSHYRPGVRNGPYGDDPSLLQAWKETPGWKAVAALTGMSLLPIVLEHQSHEKIRREIKFEVTAEMAAALKPQTGYASSSRPTCSVRLFCTSNEFFPGNGKIGAGPLPLEYPVKPEITVNSHILDVRQGAKTAGSVPPIALDLPRGNSWFKAYPGLSNLMYVNQTGPSINKKDKKPKKFYCQVVLAETHTSAQIKAKLLAGKRKTPGETRSAMKADAEDAEIEVGSYKLSLKDPNVYSRITIPIRSTLCGHLQCFDMDMWLSLNEQTPKWQCPTCEKELKLDQIFIDGFTEAILKACPDSIDDVLVEPDGEWHSDNGKYGSEKWMAAHPPGASNRVSLTNSPAGSRRNSPANFGTSSAGQASSSLNNEVVMLDEDSDDDDVDMPLATASAGPGDENSAGDGIPLPSPVAIPEDDTEAVIDLCSSDGEEDVPLARRATLPKVSKPDWAKDLDLDFFTAAGENSILGKRERDEEDDGGLTDDEEDLPLGRTRPSSQKRRVVDSPAASDPSGNNANRSGSGGPAAVGSSSRSNDNNNNNNNTISSTTTPTANGNFGFYQSGNERFVPGLRGGGSESRSTTATAGPGPSSEAGKVPRILIKIPSRGSGPPAAGASAIVTHNNDNPGSSGNDAMDEDRHSADRRLNTVNNGRSNMHPSRMALLSSSSLSPGRSPSTTSYGSSSTSPLSTYAPRRYGDVPSPNRRNEGLFARSGREERNISGSSPMWDGGSSSSSSWTARKVSIESERRVAAAETQRRRRGEEEEEDHYDDDYFERSRERRDFMSNTEGQIERFGESDRERERQREREREREETLNALPRLHVESQSSRTSTSPIPSPIPETPELGRVEDILPFPTPHSADSAIVAFDRTRISAPTGGGTSSSNGEEIVPGSSGRGQGQGPGKEMVGSSSMEEPFFDALTNVTASEDGGSKRRANGNGDGDGGDAGLLETVLGRQEEVRQEEEQTGKGMDVDDSMLGTATATSEEMDKQKERQQTLMEEYSQIAATF